MTYKQTFREWEQDYDKRVVWLREKSKVLLTTPKPVRKKKV